MEDENDNLPDEEPTAEAEFNYHAPGSWRWHEYKLVDKHPHYGEFRSIVGGRGFQPHGFFLTGYISAEDANKIIAAPDLIAALTEAELQIEYLHEKFSETGSGNAVLAKIRAALALAGPSAKAKPHPYQSKH